MKKNKILTLLFGLGFCFSLAGCDKKSNDNDQQVELGENIYTLDDHDYSKDVMKKTDTIRIHYHRDDNIGDYCTYNSWKIWGWDAKTSNPGAKYEFTHYDNYGVWADVDLTSDANSTLTRFGFLVCIPNDSGAWQKDPDKDRFIDIKEQSLGGVQHVYVRSSVVKMFDNPKDALKPILNNVRIFNSKKLKATFSCVPEDFVPDISKFTMVKEGVNYTGFSLGKYLKKSFTQDIELKDDLDITKPFSLSYKFDEEWTDKASLTITNYYDSDDFNSKYTYDGNDLGATFDDENNPTKTSFKVWAPICSSVKLNLYNAGNGEETPRTIDMVRGEKGVWSTTVNEDLDGKYYTYTVVNALGENEVTDPYAKSAGLNGKRGMVVNFTKLNKELVGWNEDVRPNFGNSATDASIYEMHVRDMTINPNSGVSEAHRGKFLGLTESGTTFTKDGVTVKTGLDHLEELGITHVQILPFYDYASVEEDKSTTEMSKDNYNWGYDPQNYNCLEGSYSTDPTNGKTRIIEFKKMVMAMHKKGININMDVVYNHTASSEGSNLNLIVPNYYYRTWSTGTFYNGSGCGNEIASNRFMGRKFIVESTKFWLDQYHLAGYRFDLMGLLDNQTMIDVFDGCRSIYDKAMVYGEPWTGGDTKLDGTFDSDKLSKQKTVQTSLAQSFFAGNNKLVGAFNDNIRNAIKGDNGPGRGWVNKGGANINSIYDGIIGTFRTNDIEKDINPGQVINYVSCHDNYTLFDHLKLANVSGSDFFRLYTQAESIVFGSQGMVFMQEGEDFMRSKNYLVDGKTEYDHNSYKSGDFVNDMDYELKINNLDTFNYFKKLVSLRKELSSLTLSTRSDITSAYSKLDIATDKVIAYRFNNVYIIHSLEGGSITLPTGNFDILLSNGEHTETSVTGSLTLEQNESIFLQKK